MCRNLILGVAWAAVIWLLPGLSVRTGGQEVPAKPRSAVPYDAVEAGAEAHREQESQRRQAISRQLGMIEDMKSRSGLTSWYGGEAYYYRQYNLDILYAIGAGRSDRSSGPASRGFGTIFERWPYVPGDIWGYNRDRPVRQPIGQRQVQVNPNRWESFPVYADTDVPPAAPPAPQQIPPPPKAENGGPREF
jgi:hypothetical protein